VSLHKAGSLAYMGYFGVRPSDPRGGYYYASADVGASITSFSGRTEGGDARWNTPVEGLMLGGSWANQTLDANSVVAALR
jgi:hypothetical protein